MSAPPFKVKAVYDYSSPHDDDLTFSIGQVITVTEEEDAEWYVGEYMGDDGVKREGLFPRNFVERHEPQAPPRPTRSRPKQELPPEPDPTPAMSTKEEKAESSQPGVEAEELAAHPQPITIKEEPAPAPKTPTAKPTPPASTKPPPPETAAKPTSGSFRDRIAAFNKPAAPPIAPKPSTAPKGQSFIKKPFVAPPPARDAYVPPPRAEAPQKIYRRDEDPEIAERRLQDQKHAEDAGLTGAQERGEGEEEPKTTSLKDRIALLQRQQQEQAARRADAATKEKPKKPAKPKPEPSGVTADEGAAKDDLTTPERAPRQSADLPRPVPGRMASRDSELDEGLKDVVSDGNEADQSGAGDTTEDAAGDSTEVEEATDRARPRGSAPPSRVPTGGTREALAEGGEQGEEEEDQEEDEEEEVDPETRRKEELRARMAKMSGGMGMAGMFGMQPSKAPAPAKKQSSGSERRRSSQEATSPPPAQRVPIMPVPGVPPRVQSPPAMAESIPEVEKEPESTLPVSEERPPEAVPDVEDLSSQSRQVSHSEPQGRPRQKSQDRPLPPLPPSHQPAKAPPVPGDRPVPHPESRPVPPPPPHAPADDEDDESVEETSPQVGRPVPYGPPAIPGLQTNLPHRNSSMSASAADKRTSQITSSPSAVPSASPPSAEKRARVPPIPTASPQMPPASALERPPPPPPPSAVPPSRQSTGRESLAQPVSAADDHESEYEGDYDTDIAPTASHKDALKARVREPSLDDESTLSEGTSARSPILTPPPIPAASRVPPPPPPPPAHDAPSRKSTDAPRAPPPAPPPRQLDDDYDPYRYDSPAPPPPASIAGKSKAPAETIQESDPSLYEISSREAQQRAPPPIPPTGPPPPHRHNVPPPLPPEHKDPPATLKTERGSSEMPRRSMEPPRQIPAGRRSMDPSSRPYGDDGSHIARDIDLAQSSVWWAQPNTPPPSFQNRTDVLYEIEESTTSKRGGRSTTTKDVYVIFQDYSQTVINVRFDPKDASQDVHLEQRHEPPPNKMRQDQLEAAHTRFGEPIAAAAMTKQNQTVGDGTAQALVLGLLQNAAAGALKPIGTRAYGALIYYNMANASVSQHDEIRPGDIVSFRNARFKGKHGAMHAKYSMDVGKPEHVAVIMEWDGTKKKIRAWEQGREKDGKKVKVESFRVGDLGAGEVKVWRVVGREWVGWDANV